MRLLLLGATGRLGGHVLNQALARGHTVTALARSPEALTVTHPNLTVIQGNVRDAAAIARVMPGHDAVVTTLGAKRAGETPDMLEIAARHVVAAMTASGVRRVVVLASAGILQRDAETLRRDAPGYPAAFKEGSGAHLAAYRHYEASDLDYTILCPPELEPGPAGPYQVLADYLPEGPKRIAMASLADFMLDALEQGLFLRQRVGITDRP